MPLSYLKYLLTTGLLALVVALSSAQTDVSVQVELATSTPDPERPFEATITVTNEGDARRGLLAVDLRLSSGLFMAGDGELNSLFGEGRLEQRLALPGASDFEPLSGQSLETCGDADLRWYLRLLDPGEQATLTLPLQVSFGGVHTVEAELVLAEAQDWDSGPNNCKPAEDDQDMACVSTPVYLTCTQPLVLRAPRGHATYTWLRDGQVLPWATTDTIHPSTSGNYEFRVGGATCTSGNCCPVMVERETCAHDLALVMRADEVAPGEDFQRVSVWIHNQGAAAVDAVELYVTISRKMRLKPGQVGDVWRLAGSRIFYDYSGIISPGDSTSVEFEIQSLSGGSARD